MESGKMKIIKHKALYKDKKWVYLCSQSIIPGDFKLTFLDENVTCKNCLRLLEKIKLVK